MQYFSMFSGIGGFELGISRSKPNWTCIGYSEVNKYAVETYSKYFNHTNYGDATKIEPKILPDFDLLVGGFPCQAFSVAGQRKGFSDTRGTLFFDISRILADKRPRYLVLENVKGLLSHDSGKTFQTILRVLTDLGYMVEWQVLNSKDFGVPQNRERVFIVGYLRGESRPQVFPIAGTDSQNPPVIGQDIAYTIDANYHKGTNTLAKSRRSLVQVNRQPLKFLQRNQKNIAGDYAYTVDSVNSGGIKVGDQIRRLTPTECERLQGFPDGWTSGQSDTQRYKQLGNAVTVDVIEHIFSKFL